MTTTTARTMLVPMMIASTNPVPPSSHPRALPFVIRITNPETTFPLWHSQRTISHKLFFREDYT